MWPASTVFSLFGPRGQKDAHNIQTVRSTQSPIQMTAGLSNQHVFIAWRLCKAAIYNFKVNLEKIGPYCSVLKT